MRSIRQPPEPAQPPAAPTAIDRSLCHTQELGNAAGTLSLSAQQNNGSAQRLALSALTHCSLAFTFLGWSQFDTYDTATYSLLLPPPLEGGSTPPERI